MAGGILERVELRGATTAKRSVVATRAEGTSRPAVLVHGIFDSVFRWLGDDADGMELPDRRILVPAFEVDRIHPTPTLGFSPKKPAIGILPRLASEGISAVAFSYQDLGRLVADMEDAVAALSAVVDFARDRWNVPRVDLVGFSRGGLVCRNALADPSFASKIHCLVTLCTPHQGSMIARFADPVQRGVDRLSSLWERITAGLTPRPRFPISEFGVFVRNLGRLTPDSPEVSNAAFPDLPGGYFALAGSCAVYFRAVAPLLGEIRLPPSFGLPEVLDGSGDTAVSVESALAIPTDDPARRCTLPVSHLAAVYDATVHDQLVKWLRSV